MNRCRAFTLIELMICVSIIGLLSAGTFGLFQTSALRGREMAMRAEFTSDADKLQRRLRADINQATLLRVAADPSTGLAVLFTAGPDGEASYRPTRAGIVRTARGQSEQLAPTVALWEPTVARPGLVEIALHLTDTDGAFRRRDTIQLAIASRVAPEATP